MQEWAKLDKLFFVIFVIIPPILVVWWGFHINSFDSLSQIFLLPILTAGVGFSIWLAYYETKD